MGVSAEVLGGWVEAMTKQLRERTDIQLAIACKVKDGMAFQKEIHQVTYYSLSYSEKKQETSLRAQCKQIIEAYQPDLIQIEGTEFLHAKVMLEEGKRRGIPTVVSMQGILNGQYAYQCGQLPVDDMMFSTSATKIFAAWMLHLRRRYWYQPRMKIEKQLIEQADYILGRTTWDRAHTYALNPRAKYYSCNRVLREPFYETSWNQDEMERHSIYVGNGYFALKGAHFVVMALAQLVNEYPDVKLYVAGYKPFDEKDKRSIFKRGYGAYLKQLIKKLGVEAHVEFTGPLQAQEVAERLAKSHVYVLSSAAENSPNTLGEAMMVGTPCVAAYVGGVPDMTTDGKEALHYRNDDPELLAWNIKRIFDDDALASRLSEAGKVRARNTHHAEENAEQLVKVYQEILSEI
jgi:glycosyltransferase involved in cell wall biosynthesis